MPKKNHQPEGSGQEFEINLESSATQKSPKSFWKRHWKKIAVVACICVAAAVILLPKRGRQANAQLQPEYLEAAPTTRDITNTYSGSGTIVAANTYTVKPMVKGTVLTADFEVGDTVEKGDVLYTIDSSDAANSLERAKISLGQAQRNYEDAEDAQYIRSGIQGTLVSLKVAAGDLVTAGQEIATIRDDSVLLLSLDFPAADAAGFAVGQTAQVTLDGNFETLSGTVRSVSGADTLNSGNLLVRTVTIAVPNTGSLTSAQAATASINGVSAFGSARFAYQREQKVTASTSGTVKALCAKEGAQVAVDTALVQLGGSALEKQLLSAEENLKTAQMSLEDTERNMEDYTITSPISGTVIQKQIKAGDTVGTSSSTSETMCMIYDLSYLEIVLNVDELQILSIKEGQSVTVTADAISDRTFEGVVTSVSSAGTTMGGTTTYPVTIRIDETGDLLPGMNATAEIIIASAEDALSVPNAAIVRGNYLLVTQDSPSAANAVAEMKAPEGYVYIKVETGISDNDYIEVKSGLTAQDTVAYDSSAANRTTDSGFPDFGMGGGMPGGGMGGNRGGGGGGMPGGGGPGGGF